MRSSTCSVCGEPILHRRTGRKAKYCKNSCRQRALRNRDFAKKYGGWHGTLDPLRNAEKTCDISTAFAGRIEGLGLRGPAHVIAAELGRTWAEIISADGVVSVVATLHPRALRSG